MKPEVPVFMTRVECPVCKTVNEYATIKMGAYTENGRDTDFCPTGRVWRNQKYQHVNPLLYFMAACSSCFYTREFNKTFKEWKSDSAFRSFRQKIIREKHLNMLASPDGLIKPLGIALDPENAPQETAITKLLLGILEEKMLERPSDLDLGRWYVRIAWIFREMAGGSKTKFGAEQIQKARLQTMLKSLRESFGHCERQMDDIQGLIDERPGAEDPCRSALGGWRSSLNPVLKSVDDLLSWQDQDMPRSAASPDDESAVVAFGGYASFDAFLHAIAGQNPEIPRNEREAVLLSLHHYRRAYEESRDVSGGNQKIQVAYMIGELARRAGEIDQAEQYFNVAIRAGHEFIYKHSQDRARTALARKILEMAIERLHECRDAGKTAS